MTSQPWVSDAPADDSGAVIRLATFLQERRQRVVFAWVELYPQEVEVPPVVQEQKRLGLFTLRHSMTPVDLDEALAWYSEAAAGSLTIPRVPTAKVEPVRLAPEPARGRLVVGADVPFEPSWHGGARLHRLVNMVDPATSVGAIAGPGDNPERWDAARAWLADRLQFDVLASDEWIGGCALLAPNPRSRGLRHQPLGRTATGGSAFRVAAKLRTGVKHDDLAIRLVERRLDGWSHISALPLDAFGGAEFVLPEPVDQTGTICSTVGWASWTIMRRSRSLRSFPPVSRSSPAPCRSTSLRRGLLDRRPTTSGRLRSRPAQRPSARRPAGKV